MRSYFVRLSCARCHRFVLLGGDVDVSTVYVLHVSWCSDVKDPPTLFRTVAENEIDPPEAQTTSKLVELVNEARRRLASTLHCPDDLSLLYLVEDVLFKLQVLGEEIYHVERTLGIALGYAIGEEGGPCPGEPIIGDHTPLTLAEEVASRLGNGSVLVK